MAKGKIGTSMGGAIEYRYELKSGVKNCQNCSNFCKRGDPLLNERKNGYCREFGILISDNSNARLCKAFQKKTQAKKAKGRKVFVGKR